MTKQASSDYDHLFVAPYAYFRKDAETPEQKEAYRQADELLNGTIGGVDDHLDAELEAGKILLASNIARIGFNPTNPL